MGRQRLLPRRCRLLRRGAPPADGHPDGAALGAAAARRGGPARPAGGAEHAAADAARADHAVGGEPLGAGEGHAADAGHAPGGRRQEGQVGQKLHKTNIIK